MLQFRSTIAICTAAAIIFGLGERALAANAPAGNGAVKMVAPTARPTPKPTPKPTAAPIPAPSGVRPVQSKQDCSSALGLLAVICDANVKAGVLQLVWHDNTAKLDGYKVYRVGGGHPTLVTTTTNGPTPKYGAISKPSGGYGSACYAVTAYRGSRESAQSGKYCVARGATATTASFSPAHVRSYVTFVNPNLGNPSNGATTILPLSGLLADLRATGYDRSVPPQLVAAGHSTSVDGTAYVGYQDAYYAETLNRDTFSTGNSRGYVKISSRGGYDFNLGKLANRTIYSAILTLDVSQTLRNNATYTGFVTSDYNCGDRYELGKDFWWSQTGALNNTATGGEIGLKPGPTVTVDVTRDVEDWAAAGDQRDYGFIISNALADTNAAPAKPNLACFTKYYNAQLKVIYF
jgi:hypothetical protein